jgi:hypothetical protein
MQTWWMGRRVRLFSWSGRGILGLIKRLEMGLGGERFCSRFRLVGRSERVCSLDVVPILPGMFSGWIPAWRVGDGNGIPPAVVPYGACHGWVVWSCLGSQVRIKALLWLIKVCNTNNRVK